MHRSSFVLPSRGDVTAALVARIGAPIDNRRGRQANVRVPNLDAVAWRSYAGSHIDRGMCTAFSSGPHAAGDKWTGHNASRYALRVIRSFGDPPTERLWARQRTKKLDPRIERTALRKLVMLDAAEVLDDLKVPLGNRLEALKGDRVGQHSIRINQQWRICFVWTPAGPDNVEIVDYH